MCKCGLRPARPGQRTCGPCHAEYMARWRKGKTQMVVTNEERAAILALRAAAAATDSHKGLKALLEFRRELERYRS